MFLVGGVSSWWCEKICITRKRLKKKYCGKSYYKHDINIHKSVNHNLCDTTMGSDSLSLMFVSLFLHCYQISYTNHFWRSFQCSSLLKCFGDNKQHDLALLKLNWNKAQCGACCGVVVHSEFSFSSTQTNSRVKFLTFIALLVLLDSSLVKDSIDYWSVAHRQETFLVQPAGWNFLSPTSATDYTRSVDKFLKPQSLTAQCKHCKCMLLYCP